MTDDTDPPESPVTSANRIVFPVRSAGMSFELRELERQTFKIAFESLLEAVAGGLSLTTFAREYHTPLSAGRFRTWIYADNNRKAAYIAAKAVGAEAIEDELIRLSDGLAPDGSPSMSDVARNSLQIATRKWVLGVLNRRRYGDIKHIEQVTTTSVDISRLSTDDLRQRLLEQMGIGASHADLAGKGMA